MRTFVLLILLASCEASQSVPPNAECKECAPELCAPYSCDPHFDVCRTSCTSSSECTGDHVCDRGRCVGTECTEESAATECGGYACVNGTCARDCALGPCAAGFYCRGDTNACVPECVTREDATCDGYLCDVEVGECEPYCLDGELGCATGYVCNENRTCSLP